MDRVPSGLTGRSALDSFCALVSHAYVMMEGYSGVIYRNKSDWPVDELIFVLAELSTGMLRLSKRGKG